MAFFLPHGMERISRARHAQTPSRQTAPRGRAGSFFPRTPTPQALDPPDRTFSLRCRHFFWTRATLPLLPTMETEANREKWGRQGGREEDFGGHMHLHLPLPTHTTFPHTQTHTHTHTQDPHLHPTHLLPPHPHTLPPSPWWVTFTPLGWVDHTPTHTLQPPHIPHPLPFPTTLAHTLATHIASPHTHSHPVYTPAHTFHHIHTHTHLPLPHHTHTWPHTHTPHSAFPHGIYTTDHTTIPTSSSGPCITGTARFLPSCQTCRFTGLATEPAGSHTADLHTSYRPTTTHRPPPSACCRRTLLPAFLDIC